MSSGGAWPGASLCGKGWGSTKQSVKRGIKGLAVPLVVSTQGATSV